MATMHVNTPQCGRTSSACQSCARPLVCRHGQQAVRQAKTTNSTYPATHPTALRRTVQLRSSRQAATLTASPVFVSVEDLRARLESGEVCLLDVRGRVETQPVEGSSGSSADTDVVEEKSTYIAERDAYLAGHIPGAVFWDWTADGLDSSASVPVQLQLDPDDFAAAVEEKGVSSDKAVVIYDDGGASMYACRVRWALKCHGHPEAFVLLGGWQAWLAAGYDTELHEPCPLTVMAEYVGELSMNQYASMADLESAARSQAEQIVDVRNHEQFVGSVRRAKYAGRVKGAKNVPYKSLMDADTGTLKAPEALRAVFGDAGVSAEDGGIVYCNGGVSACVAHSVLEALGATNWKVYDGSWNEFGNEGDPEFIETGPVAA